MNVMEIAKNVIECEIEALQKVCDNLEPDFEKIVNDILECNGKVVITGMGKSGHVGKKIAATMSSLGIPSMFLHPAEAMHGDLGVLTREDVVIAISNSGESAEVISILPNMRMIGTKIIAITANKNSTLVRYSETAYILPKFSEACALNLAPTSSTTVTMALGDALAVTVSTYKNFTEKDFGLRHPAGTLGKRLVCRTIDLMKPISYQDNLKEGDLLKEAIIKISKTGLRLMTVINEIGQVIGIITDGQIQRAIEDNRDIYTENIDPLIEREVKYVSYDSMAVDALNIMEKCRLMALPVIKDGKAIGIIEKKLITDFGIIL